MDEASAMSASIKLGGSESIKHLEKKEQGMRLKAMGFGRVNLDVKDSL